MATYSGRVLEIITEKASYAAGEVVRAKVRFQAERMDSLTAWGAWHARVKAFVGGVLKDEDETTFSVAPWTAIDRQEHTTRYFSLGAMPAYDMAGRIEIWCGG